MKSNIFPFVMAGIIGGTVTLGGNALLNRFQNKTTANEKNPYAHTVNNELPAGGVIDLSVAAAAASPAVVFIEAAESQKNAEKRTDQDPFAFFFGRGQSMPKKGTGSGVILSNDGYIVTNNHVIDFADQVRVTLTDNRKFTAKVVGTDPSTDLAVLKIEGSDLPFIQKGNSDGIKIGEWVLAIGNPFNIGSTVTAGIISAKGKKIGINESRDAIESFLQTDAVVNPGNSGGALVDAQGRLVGINAAIQSHTGSYEGYSFAIPVNLMNRVVDDIIKTGSSKRAYLGINIIPDEQFSEYAKEFDLGVTQGVIIEGVLDGGSAQYGGVLPRDVITAIDGKQIRNTSELQATVGSHRAGETINLTIIRQGKTQQLAVKLKELKIRQG
ncbi:MAG: hypothetical protein RL757_2082 [Bacteroidota bacterium]|jgi:S1-C subfamily serine protease